mmetsp:Transcript_28989/g.43749  ORF Transcript_28989/g.43749 Transcript_28989/m.43749 type:complete len:149 (+) Transcript_28989:591-1037(+)|eukprot:CAMPEP_0170484766 /NCGR_PEP_ID=MMETSP0208-20121228/4161_1 /TAXON_ID=197538 /ORGANISM="Strombidium inclinatum, Strain S3" /LENGTH=148 /DNA_ID=CAMNT_0010758187 /DNA_START=550 /DNA_END=996 /DNA_ORIENTATION=-
MSVPADQPQRQFSLLDSSSDELAVSQTSMDESNLKIRDIIYKKYTSESCSMYRKSILKVKPISKSGEDLLSDSSVEPVRYGPRKKKTEPKEETKYEAQATSGGDDDWIEIDRDDLFQFPDEEVAEGRVVIGQRPPNNRILQPILPAPV